MDRLVGTIGSKKIESEAATFLSGCQPVESPGPRFLSDTTPNEWWSKAAIVFLEIANKRSKQQQLLALRAIVVAGVDARAKWATLLSEKFTPGDVAIISKAIDELSAKSLHEIFEWCSGQYALQDYTIRFARHLAGSLFDDAQETDYLRLLASGADVFHSQYWDAYATNEKGEVYVLEPLLPHAKQTYDDVRRVVLRGGNYDTSDFGKEPEPEEPPVVINKLATVTEEQTAALAALLGTRFQAGKEQRLFVIDGYHLKNPLQALIIDSGLIWLALDERLATDKDAELALREVLAVYLRSVAPENERGAVVASQIPLDMQRIVRDSWKENEGKAPILQTSLAATVLLFEVDADQYAAMNSADRQYFNQLVGGVVNDVWAVYAEALTILGKETDTTFLPG